MRFEMKKTKTYLHLSVMPVDLTLTPTPVLCVSYAKTGQEYEVNTVKDLDYSVYKMRNVML